MSKIKQKQDTEFQAPSVEAPADEITPSVEAPADEVMPLVEEGCFVVDGKKYRVKLPKVRIPEIGERTALELAVDVEAQQWLIKNNCIGSVLEEVVS
ncbi:hypothetical protein FAM09_24815 [Niastella caeni]|uniref:Uncharacterized protein n=1 Tax=Niastella caeni TaxID=2569763 RepID=A0A4S8HKL4_9BACT|nr:hypothetical protein [Niastella caeni]THU34244.1 hypothetical protein FAM09_24815 [Niastella caeni]